MMRFAIVSLLALLSIPPSASAQSCVANSVAVQILGSGGPAVNRDRASTGYLVWIGTQAKILVDMGGGVFLRFGQAHARLRDLSLVAISHLHPDHVSDLPALLWSQVAQPRTEPLPAVGPSGNDLVPSFPTFLSRLFDAKNGVFPVLGATLGATQGSARGSVPLDVGVVDVTKVESSTVFDQQGVTVTALGIPHGNVPTLAYRVHTRDVSIVFSSDQTGTNPKFIEFAQGANILVMHLTTGVGESLPSHASPAVVGRVARDTNAGRLIVSHIGQFDLEPAIAELRKYYTGPLTVGADLQCTSVP